MALPRDRGAFRRGRAWCRGGDGGGMPQTCKRRAGTTTRTGATAVPYAEGGPGAPLRSQASATRRRGRDREQAAYKGSSTGESRSGAERPISTNGAPPRRGAFGRGRAWCRGGDGGGIPQTCKRRAGTTTRTGATAVPYAEGGPGAERRGPLRRLASIQEQGLTLNVPHLRNVVLLVVKLLHVDPLDPFHDDRDLDARVGAVPQRDHPVRGTALD